MKKSIFSMMVLMIFIGSSFAAGNSNIPPGEPKAITSLVVNANVTIILVSYPGQELQMSGDQLFMEQVTLKQTDGKLVVDGNRNRNFKARGVIYVPANDLLQIKINNSAYVRSSSTLKIPNLRIMVNGRCKVHVSTLGKIAFVENDLYEVEYQVFEKWPMSGAVAKTRE